MPKVDVSKYIAGEDVQCPSCDKLYERPIRLECEHILCTKCIYKDETGNYRCPVCKTETKLEFNDQNNLPQEDQKTLKLVTIYVEHLYNLNFASMGQPREFCVYHKSEETMMYCASCKIKVCTKCIMGNHNGHDLREKGYKQGETTTDVGSVPIHLIKHTLSSLAQREELVKEKIGYLKKEGDTIHERITKEADDCIAVIKKRQAYCHKEVSLHLEVERGKYQDILDEIKGIKSEIEVTNDHDLDLLAKGHDKATEFLQHFTLPLSSKLSFQSMGLKQAIPNHFGTLTKEDDKMQQGGMLVPKPLQNPLKEALEGGVEQKNIPAAAMPRSLSQFDEVPRTSNRPVKKPRSAGTSGQLKGGPQIGISPQPRSPKPVMAITKCGAEDKNIAIDPCPLVSKKAENNNNDKSNLPTDDREKPFKNDTNLNIDEGLPKPTSSEPIKPSDTEQKKVQTDAIPVPENKDKPIPKPKPKPRKQKYGTLPAGVGNRTGRLPNPYTQGEVETTVKRPYSQDDAFLHQRRTHLTRGHREGVVIPEDLVEGLIDAQHGKDKDEEPEKKSFSKKLAMFQNK